MQNLKLKMKNFLIVLSALVFGISVVLVSAGRVSQAQGQETIEVKDEILVEDSNAEDTDPPTGGESTEEIDYYLPYPGILPDHPLYWLKMVRDRIRLWLTNEPVAKFERLLLYSDKRVGAAKVLIEGGKKELGITTATKGEKYMERAVVQFNQLKDQEKVTPELIEKLRKATLKHQEVLQGVLEKVSDQGRASLQEAMEKSKHGYEEVMQILGKEGEKSEEDEEKEWMEEEGNTEVTEGTESARTEE